MTESNVQPFEFRGNPVATVTTGNGTVLFCAKHVATALGYSSTSSRSIWAALPLTWKRVRDGRSQIESSLDGWQIAKVASFLGVSKGSLYVWSCHDKWGGRYPPAPKRVGRRLVWNPQEVIDYRDRRCAISRKELVYGE